jgi:hypothetical protein
MTSICKDANEVKLTQAYCKLAFLVGKILLEQPKLLKCVKEPKPLIRLHKEINIII